MPHASIRPGYQFFMLVLSVYAMALVAVQLLTDVDAEVARILNYSDLAVCILFMVDFVVSLHGAPDRWKYFRTWGWIDLLSSIPVLDVARWGRFARILRAARVLRGIRATRILTGALMRQRAENGVLAAILAAIVLATACSVAILQVETLPTSTIRSAPDAAWWAISTITTVGYGDVVPVTPAGRAIAAVLMIAGVALFTTFSGFLASWFIRPNEASRAEVRALRHEIAELRAELRAGMPRRSSADL